MLRKLSLARLALLTGIAACNGDIGGSPDRTTATGTTATGTTGAGTTGTSGTGAGGSTQTGTTPPGVTPPPPEFKPAPGGLRRLTLPQYRNAIADLFEGRVTVTTDIEPDTGLSGFASIGASLVSLSNRILEQFEAASLDIAHKALLDPAGRAAFVGCNPTAATDDACTQTFIRKFGRRAWRRSLSDEDVTKYAMVVKSIQTASKSFFVGLEYGIAGLLQSPNFLYRQELGIPDAANSTRRVFDDFELATRLSFFLWNTTPDDALLDAAEAKQLTQGNGFAAAVQRLLQSPRVSQGIETFFGEYFRLTELDGLPQLPTIFPQKTDTLGPAMREESRRFFGDLALGRDADFREMFDSPTTFVNAELAKLYGLPPVSGTGFVKVTLPDTGLRVGFFGQGSFLALNAHADVGSPTYRGKFMREMLMCQSIPPPPPNVPPLPADTDTMKMTARQKLEIHRQKEPCKGCHAFMDPLGLALENFDGIGAFRTMDAGQVIDASGELDGVKFDGPRGLAKAMRENPDVMACVARNLYRYVLGHLEIEGEEPAVLQLAKKFQDGGYHFAALVDGMVNSAGFALAAPPSENVTPGTGGSGGTGGAGGSGGSGATPDSGMGGSASDAGSIPTVPPGPLGYAKHIAPIIAANCAPCHTTDAKAGLNFNYDNLVTNSTLTNALTKACNLIAPLVPPKRVVPGDPDHSLIWVKLTSDDHATSTGFCGDHMPPTSSGKIVPTVQIDTIGRWIQQGAMP